MARKASKRKVADMGEAAGEAPADRPTVIQLIGLVSGAPHALDGRYVKRYHPGPPSMLPGQCLLITVGKKEHAKVYASVREAHEEWVRVDPRAPIRPHDGKPNRPLTAWSVLFLPAGA